VVSKKMVKLLYSTLEEFLLIKSGFWERGFKAGRGFLHENFRVEF